MWFECPDCIFQTNSRKQAEHHRDEKEHGDFAEFITYNEETPEGSS